MFIISEGSRWDNELRHSKLEIFSVKDHLFLKSVGSGPPSTSWITIQLNLCFLESLDGWNLGALIAANTREKLNIRFSFKKPSTFYFTFPLHSQCEDYIWLRYIFPLCCERFYIYAFAISSCSFEFKSQQLVRRSSQPHGSSQIISSTPLLLTTACAWNVSVPLENTVGAHPRGWVGSSCLHHISRQQRADELLRPAKAGWSIINEIFFWINWPTFWFSRSKQATFTRHQAFSYEVGTFVSIWGRVSFRGPSLNKARSFSPSPSFVAPSQHLVAAPHDIQM